MEDLSALSFCPGMSRIPALMLWFGIWWHFMSMCNTMWNASRWVSNQPLILCILTAYAVFGCKSESLGQPGVHLCYCCMKTRVVQSWCFVVHHRKVDFVAMVATLVKTGQATSCCLQALIHSRMRRRMQSMILELGQAKKHSREVLAAINTNST